MIPENRQLAIRHAIDTGTRSVVKVFLAHGMITRDELDIGYMSLVSVIVAEIARMKRAEHGEGAMKDFLARFAGCLSEAMKQHGIPCGWAFLLPERNVK